MPRFSALYLPILTALAPCGAAMWIARDERMKAGFDVKIQAEST
jgi:hypothetical protein